MVKETKFYDLLGVMPQATHDEIKRAYRQQALKWHPDKNRGIEEAETKFKEICAAFQILSDPDKRRTYDQFGETGLSRPCVFFDAAQFFANLFGFAPCVRKSDDIVLALHVNLEDLYNGKMNKLSLNRQIVCPICRGKGGKKIQACRSCSDAIRQHGPQFDHLCDSCQITNERNTCPGCAGAKTIRHKSYFDVEITKGMRDGTKIVFAGLADEAPGVVAGDVILVVQAKPHARFRRSGCNLIYTHKLSLREALCGSTFYVKHLDGRMLKLSTSFGDVIRPGLAKKVAGEGMPHHKPSHPRGDLYIVFDVEFPSDLSATLGPESLEALRQLLPRSARSALPVDQSVTVTEVTLVDLEQLSEGNSTGRVPSKAHQKAAHSSDGGDAQEAGHDQDDAANGHHRRHRHRHHRHRRHHKDKERAHRLNHRCAEAGDVPPANGHLPHGNATQGAPGVAADCHADADDGSESPELATCDGGTPTGEFADHDQSTSGDDASTCTPDFDSEHSCTPHDEPERDESTEQRPVADVGHALGATVSCQ